jgi:hypothetical protein
MRAPVALLLAGSLVASAAVHAGGLSDILQNPIKDLIAKDTDARATARDLIQKQFEASQPAEKRSVTDELLGKIKSAPEPADRLTAAITLSKLKSPWEATDHENQIKDLYQTFQTTPDPALKRYIDDALANAKGLYLDAINDFNGDHVENPAGTAAKFARMPTDFPKSRYAASSAYYLGQYWTRVAFIQSNFPDNIPKSDEAFKRFIERSKANAFASADFLTDAYFFKALNRILVGKEQEALAQLADMRKEFASRNPNIYVYQLFYKTKDKSTEIDRYIPALTLIDATTRYIQENPGRLPAAQSDLAKQLLSSTKS